MRSQETIREKWFMQRISSLVEVDALTADIRRLFPHDGWTTVLDLLCFSPLFNGAMQRYVLDQGMMVAITTKPAIMGRSVSKLLGNTGGKLAGTSRITNSTIIRTATANMRHYATTPPPLRMSIRKCNNTLAFKRFDTVSNLGTGVKMLELPLD